MVYLPSKITTSNSAYLTPRSAPAAPGAQKSKPRRTQSCIASHFGASSTQQSLGGMTDRRRTSRLTKGGQKLFFDRVDADLVADQLRIYPRIGQNIEVTPAAQPTAMI